MNFRILRLLTLFVLLTGSALSARSQTTAFSYQGGLTEVGAPVTGDRIFRFTLYDENGAAIPGAEIVQTITVNRGVFSTASDFGAANFPGAIRTFEIAVKVNAGDAYTVLNPRQPVLATPYSIKSLTADNATTLGGVDSTLYVQQDAGGNISVAGGLTVNGALSLDTVNAQTQFNLAGNRILSNAGNSNLFVGSGSGSVNSGSYNTFVGNLAGNANTTGTANSFFGNTAGYGITSGSRNSLFGAGSGNNNLTGSDNAFFGFLTGSHNVLGNNNSFFGTEAGFNTNATDNSFFGAYSGTFNTTGYDNAFFGRGSGYANTTGRENSFFGKSSGLRNTIGIQNVFFGINAGINNTTGNFNTFLGSAAGSANQTGSDNTFVGQYSGLKNTTSSNSFFGAYSGRENTTGTNNTFVGTSSGAANVIGNDNTFVGRNSGLNNTAGGNSFFGSSAGFSNTTGTANSFFGTEAGKTNTTSISNAFFGSSAGKLNTAGSFNAFFGFEAGAKNTTGEANNFFGSNTGYNNTTGSYNTFNGVAAGLNNDGGNLNVFIGGQSGWANVNGNKNTLLGVSTNVGADNLTNATAIGANAVVSQSNSLVLGNNANVGIGTTTPNSKLTVVGLIESTTGGVKFPDGTVQTTAGGGGGGVTAVNGLTGNVTLAEGTGITLTPVGNTITIATGGGVSPILNQTSPQAGANFNITGVGTASIFDATSQYALGGQRIIGTPGQNNLFVGKLAGAVTPVLGDGNFENTFFGTSAGQNNRDCCNAFFGNYAGQSNTTGGGNTFLGYQAGILKVAGSNNTLVGINSGSSLQSGDGNTFVGDRAGNVATTGLNNTFLGRNANVAFGSGTLEFAAAIGAGSVVSTSNTVVIGKAAIGPYPADTVRIPGDLVVTGTFSNPSDARLKTGISNLRYGLGEVMRLRPVTWQWNGDLANKPRLGLVAQEVQNVIPELIEKGTDKDEMLSMNYLGLLPVMINAIQEQESVITELKAEVADLQKQLADLKAQPYAKARPGLPSANMILRSPDGTTCRQMSIDNTGSMVLKAVPCQ